MVGRMEVRMVLAPYHAGSFGVRVGAGPIRLMDDGLEHALHRAGFDTSVCRIERVDEVEGEIGRSFELMRRIAAAVAEAREAGAFPLVLAGNCNSSVGATAGVGEPEAGLIWFDAHPDFDTPDEHRSGYFDGMGVATLAGRCWHALAATIPGFEPIAAGRIVYCGIRDFEPGQLEKVRACGIAAATGNTNARTDYLPALIAYLEALPLTSAMIHIDMDCLDISVGQANEYAVPGGLSAGELLRCLDAVCERMRPLSLTIASFNPDLEGADRISQAAIEAAVRVATFASG